MALEEEAAELQKKLADIDFDERPRDPSLVTFLVKKLKYLQIRMEGDKAHQRPHVHIVYGNERHAATYAIDNSKCLVGALPARHDREVREWTANHKQKLLGLWRLTLAGKPTTAVICELQSSA